MAKAKPKKEKAVVVADVGPGPFGEGDLVSLVLPVNGAQEGTGDVVTCDSRAVRVAFKTGPLAGNTMRIPVYSVQLVKTAKRIKELEQRAKDALK